MSSSNNGKPLVLITGATGHIGFRTLVALVESGFYAARISVRREALIKTLQENPALVKHADSIESFVVVPDITAAGAFDEAVKGVDFVLHIASPIPDLSAPEADLDVKRDFLIPAVRGTESILESAAKSPSIKRVVVTSSVAAIGPKDGKSLIGPYDLQPVPTIDDDFPRNVWVAYRNSKILSHDAGTKFMEEKKPHFSLVRVLPCYTQGRNDLVTESAKLESGSNQQMVALFQGKKSSAPAPGELVLVDDVAWMHVAALDLNKAKDGENFIAASEGGTFSRYSDVDDIARKLFPDHVASGVLPLGGSQPNGENSYDIQNAITELGYKPAGLEAMVKSLGGQFIELVEKERATCTKS